MMHLSARSLKPRTGTSCALRPRATPHPVSAGPALGLKLSCVSADRLIQIRPSGPRVRACHSLRLGIHITQISESVGGTMPSNRRRIVAIGVAVAGMAVALGTPPALAVAATPSLTDAQGRVVAWGSPHHGRTHVPSEALEGVSAISAGQTFSLALKQGRVIMWGSEWSEDMAVPDELRSGVSAIAAGSLNALAIKGGRVIAWGKSTGLEGAVLKVPPQAQSGVSAITASSMDALAIKDGSVIAWGQSTAVTSTPDEVASGVSAISVGSGFGLALKEGRVIAWGTNNNGSLDVPAEAESGVTAIAAAFTHALALKGGKVIAWGDNRYGATDVPDEAKTGVTAIATSNTYSMALKDGRVIVWGEGKQGIMDIPKAARSGVTQIAANWFHALAITQDVSTPTMSIRCRIEHRDHHRWMRCHGSTAGLSEGTTVRPMMRLSRNGSWTSFGNRHEASIKAGGGFTWSMRAPDSPRAWIKFETRSTSSNVAELLINYQP